jgi:hypothetical protein
MVTAVAALRSSGKRTTKVLDVLHAASVNTKAQVKARARIFIME